jgi:hypothetical protein
LTYLSSKGSSAEPDVKPSSSLATFRGVLSLFEAYSESELSGSFFDIFFFFFEKNPIPFCLHFGVGCGAVGLGAGRCAVSNKVFL